MTNLYENQRFFITDYKAVGEIRKDWRAARLERNRMYAAAFESLVNRGTKRLIGARMAIKDLLSAPATW